MKQLLPALRKAMMGWNGVVRDSTNPHFRNRYASLEAVIDTVRKPMLDNGLLFTQMPGTLTQIGNTLCLAVTTTIWHESGEFLESTIQVPLQKQDPQGVGSAITYACRYALMAVLGLPPVDDDGEAARASATPAVAAKPVAEAKDPVLSAQTAEMMIKVLRTAHAVADLEEWKRLESTKMAYKNLNSADFETVKGEYQKQLAKLEKAA